MDWLAPLIALVLLVGLPLYIQRALIRWWIDDSHR